MRIRVDCSSPSWDEFVARHSMYAFPYPSSCIAARKKPSLSWRTIGVMWRIFVYSSPTKAFTSSTTRNSTPPRSTPVRSPRRSSRLETFYPWYYKRYLYFRNNSLTSFPSGMHVLDSVYLFLTRGWGGWNNIYHHTEWVNNLLRYVHNAASLPRVESPRFLACRWKRWRITPIPSTRIAPSAIRKAISDGVLRITRWPSRSFRPRRCRISSRAPSIPR